MHGASLYGAGEDRARRAGGGVELPSLGRPPPPPVAAVARLLVPGGGVGVRGVAPLRSDKLKIMKMFFFSCKIIKYSYVF